MSELSNDAHLELVNDVDIESPTLIEGLPGLGLVAAIAVDQISDQLGLEHYGSIHAAEFPPVVTFENGLIQDLVRVYASESHGVMTLQSDLALPQRAFEGLSRCVLSELAETFERAIFLAGAPAESEDQLGEVRGIATTPELVEELEDVGVEIPDEHGVVGGITGAIVRECYRADVPATLLIVRAHPQLPDPGAARAVIETALEPMVDFDIDTTPLEEQAEDIRRQMQQVARQYQQVTEDESPPEARTMSMYQ